jgi:hypothetical protein
MISSARKLDSGAGLCHAVPMSKGRPRVPYLRVDFKVSLPAALAAEVDLMFVDPLTNRPKYGARAKLIQALLENWLADQRGGSVQHVPSLEELRDARN